MTTIQLGTKHKGRKKKTKHCFFFTQIKEEFFMGSIVFFFSIELAHPSDEKNNITYIIFIILN
jgi:hypothetical protein